MEKLSKTIYIGAPLTTVFNYLSDPSHLLHIWPGAIAIIAVEPLPRGGHNFRWIRKFCAVRFEGVSEYVPDINRHQILFKTSGGLISETSISLTPEEHGTRAILTMEYVFPAPLHQKHTIDAVIHQGEHDAELFLLNLNAEMMTQEAVRAEQMVDAMPE